MALTEQVLKSNLAGLTPEQIATIVTLSTNDEASVIGTKIGELHGGYDRDVLAISGVEKQQGEKSYDYVKRVLSSYKTQVDSSATLNTQLSQLKSEKAELEKQLRENAGDAAIKQKLTDTEAKLQQLQTLYTTEKQQLSDTISDLNKSVLMAKVDSEFDKSISQLKFKQTIPESVRQVLIANAKNELLSVGKPDFIEENGKKVLVFRDKDGNIMNNPDNVLKPFTATELLTSKLKDAIDTGRRQQGGDTKEGSDHSSDTIDISSAKNQVEADDMISKHLLSKGLLRRSPDFANELTKLRKENNVDKLPVR